MSGHLFAALFSALLFPPVCVFVMRFRSRGKPSPLRWAIVATLGWLNATGLLWLSCTIETLLFFGGVIALTSFFLPKGQSRAYSQRLLSTRFGLYLLSVFAIVATLHFHLPVGTFLTSPGEIGINFDHLISEHIKEAMAWAYSCTALYALVLTSRMRTILLMMSMGSLALLLVYSYVLPFGYPMMSGLMFEQVPISGSALAFRGAADVAVVLLVSWGISHGLLHLSPRKIVAGLVVVNVSMLGATGFSMLRDVNADESGGGPASEQTSRPLRFSKDDPNILILFLDRFMGGFVEEILEEHPELNTKLTGFTWFPRTLAAGQNSIAGVHPIFGGYDYTPEQMNARGGNLRELSVEAFRILPENFSNHGYDSHFINPRGLGFTMLGDCSFVNDIQGMHCTHVSAQISKRMAQRHRMPLTALSQANYGELLTLLATMRAVPYLTKNVLHAKGPWRPFMDHSAGTTFKQWAELVALPELSSTDSKTRNLNVFWNILPHEPYFMGTDCRPKSTQLEVSQQMLDESGHPTPFAYQHAVAARCSLIILADYLEWMKRQKVYDNTMIVIVSDHGIVGPANDLSSRAVEGGTVGELFVASRSVLLVKERNAHGPLRVSEEFMPNADVPRLVCREIGGCINPYLKNRSIAAHGRDDPFIVDFVPWQFSRQKEKSFVIQERYMLKGRDPYSIEGWKRQK